MKIRPASPTCLCEWPRSCGGSGLLICDGCGGESCVCLCGGQQLCPGCAECDEEREAPEALGRQL
jgi:hypothetical protein